MRICIFGKPDSPQLRRVVASLAARGHRIHVVYRGPGDVPGATYERFEIPDACLRNPHRWDGRQRRYLEAFMQNHDVVSIQFLHSWGFTPEMMQCGCFTVRPWGSDISPPPAGPQPSAETLERRRDMLRCAAAVSVTCDSFARVVAEFAGIDAAAIGRTPLGVDPHEFTPPPAAPSTPVVGFLKGFGHAYGAETLMRAIPRIVAACPDTRFELVGDGPELGSCRDLAEITGAMRCIRWLPPQSPQSVPATLARWSLSVIPSVCESFGIAALESAAMCVPVVASAVGGLRETVRDGETGTLVAPGDAHALADAIIELLRDDTRRGAMGEAGRAFVAAHYAWDRCMDAWEAFFANALQQSQAATMAAR